MVWASRSSMHCRSTLSWRCAVAVTFISSRTAAASRRTRSGGPARPRAGGQRVTFKPDEEIFETTTFSYETLARRMRELAFLNPGLAIEIEDRRSEPESEAPAQRKQQRFFYKGGLSDFVRYLNKNKTTLHGKPVHVQARRAENDVEVALQYNDGYNESLFSFVNTINTPEGGTHMVGFKTALTRTINAYASSNNLLRDLKQNLSGEDVREGIVAVVSIKIPNPPVRGPDESEAGEQRDQGNHGGRMQ